MAKYAVYIRQVNQARIEVEVDNKEEARWEAVARWREQYAFADIIGVEELPNIDTERVKWD